MEEDVAPDVAPSNSSDDDESIEEESDDVDENEEYDADADEESKRQQGLVMEARTRRLVVREEGRRQQGLVVEARTRRLVVREEGRLVMVKARPRVLGKDCIKHWRRQGRQGKGNDRDPVLF